MLLFLLQCRIEIWLFIFHYDQKRIVVLDWDQGNGCSSWIVGNDREMKLLYFLVITSNLNSYCLCWIITGKNHLILGCIIGSRHNCSLSRIVLDHNRIKLKYGLKIFIFNFKSLNYTIIYIHSFHYFNL